MFSTICNRSSLPPPVYWFNIQYASLVQCVTQGRGSAGRGASMNVCIVRQSARTVVPLFLPPLSLLRLPLPASPVVPPAPTSPPCFLPLRLSFLLSTVLSSFSSVYLSHPPVRSCISDSLSLSVSPFFSIPTYLSIYYQLSLSTGSSSFSSFVLHQSFSLSLSASLPPSPFHTQRRARARMYARSLMDNRSIFFSLFPLCFSFVPSILLLLFLLLLFLLLLRMSSI